MKSMRPLDVPMSDAVRGLTLRVRITGVTAFKVRAWLGVKLIALAARVIGCELTIAMEDR